MMVPSIQGRIEQVGQAARAQAPVAYPADAVFPPPPADLAACFAGRLDALRAPGDAEPAVMQVANTAAAAAVVMSLCRGVSREEIVWQEDGGPGPEAGTIDPPRDRRIGIGPAAALIASNGTVVVELSGRGAARASLLVDLHLVVADQSQLLPDLPTFYRQLATRRAGGERLPVQVCITGCSRTADIEKLLVIPAHGPRQVRVVLSAAPLDWAVLQHRLSAGDPQRAAEDGLEDDG